MCFHYVTFQVISIVEFYFTKPRVNFLPLVFSFMWWLKSCSASKHSSQFTHLYFVTHVSPYVLSSCEYTGSPGFQTSYICYINKIFFSFQFFTWYIFYVIILYFSCCILDRMIDAAVPEKLIFQKALLLVLDQKTTLLLV